jgi:RND family efflux transporter MFP subunit
MIAGSIKIYGCLFWLCCGGLIICGCSDKDTAEDEVPPTPVPVITMLVSREVVHRPVPCAGIVHPLQQESLTFPYSGVIDTIDKAEGDRVVEGDTLASLDSTSLTHSWVKWGLELIVERQKFERMEALRERGNVNETEYKNQDHKVTSLKEVYFNAKYARLDRFLIASFSGTILNWYASVGDSVKSGRPVVFLVDIDPSALARVGLTEDDYHQVELGDSAVVVPLDTLELPLLGVVQSRGLATDLSELPFCADVIFENPGGLVPFGTRVTATIRSKQTGKAVMIPKDALVDRQDGSASVFLTDRRAKFAVRRHVDLGPEVGFDIIIEKGLRGGERLIIHGQDRLKHGSPIILLSSTQQPERRIALPGVN